MEFFKQWTLCVCITLVCGVVFSLFTPRGKMKATYQMLISLFIFLSFLYPFKDFKTSDFDFSSFFGDIAVTEDQSSTTYETMVNQEIKELLTENGVTGAVVSSRIQMNYETGEAEIESVQIAISDEYDIEETQRLVFEKLGINTKVIYIGS